MCKSLLPIACALLCVASSFSAVRAADKVALASLSVTVKGAAAGGVLHVGLYDEPTYSEKNGAALSEQTIAATAGTMRVEFSDLPPGYYALRAFQDVNGDGKQDAGERSAAPTCHDANNHKAPSENCDADFDKASFLLHAGPNTAALELSGP